MKCSVQYVCPVHLFIVNDHFAMPTLNINKLWQYLHSDQQPLAVLLQAEPTSSPPPAPLLFNVYPPTET